MREQAFEIEPLPPFYEEFAEAFGEKQIFIIGNDQRAEWAINALRKDEEQFTRQIDVCDKEIARYQENKRRLIEERDGKAAHLTYMLQSYFRTVKPRETKTQYAYDLPSGSLIQKKPTIAYERDDALLLAYLKASAPEYVKTVESPKWDEFKKARLYYSGKGVTVADSETGECVPGVTAVEKPGGFTIKAAKEAG
ncbi:MAG TPA: hypothetical protein DEQ02_05655 [Ruminococcaceae bacterium]|nr:hypothetical protein [Oscillospiraceae bacterium]